MRSTPVIGFAAFSGTGKTTLIESLIPTLHERGLRVGIVKHDGHDFDIDRPGKDSWRFTSAGAEVSAIFSAGKAAIIESRPLNLDDMFKRVRNVDIILVEGCKDAAIPQIGICRKATGKGFTAPLEHFIAVVTDRDDIPNTVPHFSFQEVEKIVDFIINNKDKHIKAAEEYTAAVITVSDKGSRGERIDTSGPMLCELLQGNGFRIIHTAVVPDEAAKIHEQLILCADELKASLILTTGGTGFSPRDITPEVTLDVIERETPGIPELMRAASVRITPKGCLSRSRAGIRGRSLIINLPGSEKAAKENILSVLEPVRHGLEMLLGEGSANCGGATGIIKSVCISEHKGEQKHAVDSINLRENWGIDGDAHAGNWHRQVSLLGAESVKKVQKHISFDLLPGAFAENILCEGICLYELPVGTKLRIGSALCEVSQIGKECHNDCAIRKAAGDCVMPREGIFVKVLEAGKAVPGDTIAVVG